VPGSKRMHGSIQAGLGRHDTSKIVSGRMRPPQVGAHATVKAHAMQRCCAHNAPTAQHPARQARRILQKPHNTPGKDAGHTRASSCPRAHDFVDKFSARRVRWPCADAHGTRWHLNRCCCLLRVLPHRGSACGALQNGAKQAEAPSWTVQYSVQHACSTRVHVSIHTHTHTPREHHCQLLPNSARPLLAAANIQCRTPHLTNAQAFVRCVLCSPGATRARPAHTTLAQCTGDSEHQCRRPKPHQLCPQHSPLAASSTGLGALGATNTTERDALNATSQHAHQPTLS
jgi:hypothetical protein